MKPISASDVGRSDHIVQSIKHGKVAPSLVVLTFLLSASACSPYPGVPPITGGATNNSTVNVPDAPNTDIGAALAYVRAYQEELHAKRSEQTNLRTAAGALVFGGAVATGASALYGASRDLVIGLGLGTATTYVGSSLYLPRSYSSVYNAGIETVGCIEEATQTIYADSQIIDKKIRQIEEKIKDLRQAYDDSDLDDKIQDFLNIKQKWNTINQQPQNFETNGDLKSLFNTTNILINTYDDVLYRTKEIRSQSVKNIAASEHAISQGRVYQDQVSIFSSKVISRVRNIGYVINQIIDEQQPRLDAVFAAGQGISARGLGIDGQAEIQTEPQEGQSDPIPTTAEISNQIETAPTPESKSDGGEMNPEIKQQLRDILRSFEGLSGWSDSIIKIRSMNEDIVRKTNDLIKYTKTMNNASEAEAALTKCNLSTDDIGGGTISVQPTGPIEIAGGESVSLVVSGGQPPHFVSWIGSEPDGLGLNVVPQGANRTRIQLKAGSGFQGNYSLLISDRQGQSSDTIVVDGPSDDTNG